MFKSKIISAFNKNESLVFRQELKLRNIREDISELQKKVKPKYIEYQLIANNIDRIIIRLSRISLSKNSNDCLILAKTKELAWETLEKLERNCKTTLNKSIW